MREAIQNSQESLKTLAARYSLNVKTVANRTYALTTGINLNFSSASRPFTIKSLTTPINKSFLSW
ncbi:hypothetical protein K661_02600 [Piscirickettsia salmonis LF-89 = ATCC VR-1361]|nr:hypothetical protein K661_02600 [Piscirickettsia salmonis LF-89 = ATCC VR-1361]